MKKFFGEILKKVLTNGGYERIMQNIPASSKQINNFKQKLQKFLIKVLDKQNFL